MRIALFADSGTMTASALGPDAAFANARTLATTCALYSVVPIASAPSPLLILTITAAPAVFAAKSFGWYRPSYLL